MPKVELPSGPVRVNLPVLVRPLVSAQYERVANAALAHRPTTEDPKRNTGGPIAEVRFVTINQTQGQLPQAPGGIWNWICMKCLRPWFVHPRALDSTTSSLLVSQGPAIGPATGLVLGPATGLAIGSVLGPGPTIDMVPDEAPVPNQIVIQQMARRSFMTAVESRWTWFFVVLLSFILTGITELFKRR